MSKGFVYYFKRSWSQAAFAYKKLSFLTRLKLSVFYLVCLGASGIFFLRPIFTCAIFNAGKMVEETHALSIGKCFEGVTKRYKDLFIAELYVFFVIVVVVGLLFLPNLGAIMFPTARYQFVYDIIRYSTIGLASLMAFLIELKYVALPYVAINSNELSAGDLLHNTMKTKVSSRFKFVIATIIFALLTFLIPVGIIYGSFVFINLNRSLNIEYIIPIALGVGAILYLLFGGFFLLVYSTFLYALFKDGVSTKKVLIVRELSGHKVGYASIFPSEIDDYVLYEDEDKEDK